jgi:hypothetical protein
MAAGPHLKIYPKNPHLNTERSHIEVVESGVDRHNPSSASKSALEAIHGIEGEIVGTEKTQTLTNKTYLGNGAGLTDLDGDEVTTGTVVAGRLPTLDAITAPAAAVAMNSQKITGLADPVADTDASTKQYVDDKYSRTEYSESFGTNDGYEWDIAHNLGYYPDVTALKYISGTGAGSDYEEFEAHVQHNSTNDLTITTTGLMTAKVLLR